MRKHISLILPAVLIVIYIISLILVRKSFPTSSELLSYLSSFYGRFGYEIIFLGSMLEALILINLFVPGAVAVGLGAIFARAGELNLTVGIILAVLGALLGYILDFYLGYFGFSEIFRLLGWESALGKVKGQLKSSFLRSFSLGFIHPDIGAVVSLAAGALRMNFMKFFLLAFLSTLAWYSLWGILGFALGEVFLTILTKYGFILLTLVMSIWILSMLYGQWSKKR